MKIEIYALQVSKIKMCARLDKKPKNSNLKCDPFASLFIYPSQFRLKIQSLKNSNLRHHWLHLIQSFPFPKIFRTLPVRANLQNFQIA